MVAIVIPCVSNIMSIIDSHFHWWPRSVFEEAIKRTDYPRVERNDNGGFNLCRNPGMTGRSRQDAEWFNLDDQLAHMATLGYDVDVICSIGPFSLYFSEIPVEEGRKLAMRWNEEMAGAQRRHAEQAGRAKETGGSDQTLADVLADIHARDARDSGRSAAPLVQASDAALLDTSNLSIAAAVAAAIALVEKARAQHSR